MNWITLIHREQTLVAGKLISNTSAILSIIDRPAWRRVGPMSLLVVLPSESALYQFGQLIRSAVDGLVQSWCLVSDCNWLSSFEAGFHHAALVAGAVPMACLVAQMDFHLRDVSAESAQGTLYFPVDLVNQRLVTHYIVVCVNLNLHYILLCDWLNPASTLPKLIDRQRTGIEV